MDFLDSRLPDRFWAKCIPEPNSGCWLWLGSLTKLPHDRGGYARYMLDGKVRRAHRVSYEVLVGRIGVGLEIDHRCRVRCCVNPAHMEPVTHLVNVQRGTGGAKNARKTHCPQGHEYTPQNTYRYANDRHRVCRRCAIDFAAERQARSA